MINTVKKYDALSKQYDKMLEERNSLIDDIDWQQKKIERLEDENKEMLTSISNKVQHIFKLERENDDYHMQSIEADDKIARLESENERLTNRVRKLNLNGQMQHDDLMMCDAESQSYKAILSEFSQHIGNKPSSSTYKYFRAKLDGLNIKEGNK